jgi:hypothetical protein
VVERPSLAGGSGSNSSRLGHRLNRRAARRVTLRAGGWSRQGEPQRACWKAEIRVTARPDPPFKFVLPPGIKERALKKERYDSNSILGFKNVFSSEVHEERGGTALPPSDWRFSCFTCNVTYQYDTFCDMIDADNKTAIETIGKQTIFSAH